MGVKPYYSSQAEYYVSEFIVHGSLHRNNIPKYIQQDATLRRLFYLETALHVVWVAYATHSTLKPVPALSR